MSEPLRLCSEVRIDGCHVGGKNNSDKVFDEKEFDYYFANLERHFAIAWTTNMGVSSCENCEDKYSNIKPSDESYRFDLVMSGILRQKFRCAVECRPSFYEKGSLRSYDDSFNENVKLI